MRSLHLRWLSGDGTPRTARIPLWLVLAPVVAPMVLAVVLALLWNGEWSPARLREKLDALERGNERINRKLTTANRGVEAARKALRIPDRDRLSIRELAGLPQEEEVVEAEERVPDVAEMIAKARGIRVGYEAMEKWFETHPAETGRLPTIRPVSADHPLVEDFGTMLDPFTGQEIEFPGLSWSVPVGTPVWATGAGTVAATGTQGRWGKFVEIRHDKRCLTFYAHLSRIDVKEGDAVGRGQVVGLSGESGKVTGSQLTYAVYLDGEPVDPAAFLLPEDSRVVSK